MGNGAVLEKSWVCKAKAWVGLVLLGICLGGKRLGNFSQNQKGKAETRKEHLPSHSFIHSFIHSPIHSLLSLPSHFVICHFLSFPLQSLPWDFRGERLGIGAYAD